MAATPPPKRHPYDQWAPDARALDLVGDKWTLLIVRDLASGPRRFVELQRVLPGISTEQLRSRLNRMVADGLLTRQRYREVPPRVDYELTARSRELLPVLGALARWGYDWVWTAPREGEAIDIGAILRIVPGLASPPASVSGTAELTVTRRDGSAKVYALAVAGGSVTISEGAAADAEARISGSEQEWIDALGPAADRDALSISGDERVATTVLDGVRATAARAVRAA
jgi:DNA-binding HxlR family transcriptional regulator